MDREQIDIKNNQGSSVKETILTDNAQSQAPQDNKEETESNEQLPNETQTGNQELINEETVEEQEHQKEKKKMKANDYVFISVLSVIIVLLATYILLFSTVFYHVEVSGSSMSPTLTSGDILVAKRDASKVNRGDIIIIANKASAGSLLIKRVIGIGGDEIVIEDGKVYRNGELLIEEYILRQDSTFAPDCTDDSGIEKKVYNIGENEVFFLGDNRTDSLDSRYYSTCELENIVGIVEQSAVNIKHITTPINKVIIKIKGFFGIKSYGTIANALQ